jgi:hypothetical protein
LRNGFLKISQVFCAEKRIRYGRKGKPFSLAGCVKKSRTADAESIPISEATACAWASKPSSTLTCRFAVECLHAGIARHYENTLVNDLCQRNSGDSVKRRIHPALLESMKMSA